MNGLETQPERKYSTEQLFRDLEGQQFERYDEFRGAVRDLFVANLAEFPVGYDFEDAISYAHQKKLINPVGRIGLEIRFPESETK